MHLLRGLQWTFGVELPGVSDDRRVIGLKGEAEHTLRMEHNLRQTLGIRKGTGGTPGHQQSCLWVAEMLSTFVFSLSFRKFQSYQNERVLH